MHTTHYVYLIQEFVNRESKESTMRETFHYAHIQNDSFHTYIHPFSLFFHDIFHIHKYSTIIHVLNMNLRMGYAYLLHTTQPWQYRIQPFLLILSLSNVLYIMFVTYTYFHIFLNEKRRPTVLPLTTGLRKTLAYNSPGRSPVRLLF